MKKMTIILACICIACGIFEAAYGGEVNLTLTAAASSIRTGYEAAKAVDSNVNTYWSGASAGAPWWITVDQGELAMVTKIIIKWYSSSTTYLPYNYDIQVSADNSTWQNVYSAIKPAYSATGEIRVINRDLRYIRLYMRQSGTTTPTPTYPIIREVEVYAKPSEQRILRFQGRLGNSAGVPLDGTFDLTFRIYNTATGGEALWTEIQQAVIVEDGLIDVELGSVTPLNILFLKQYWLGIEVGSDGEMTPRFKLTCVPYSLTSEK